MPSSGHDHVQDGKFRRFPSTCFALHHMGRMMGLLQAHASSIKGRPESAITCLYHHPLPSTESSVMCASQMPDGSLYSVLFAGPHPAQRTVEQQAHPLQQQPSKQREGNRPTALQIPKNRSSSKLLSQNSNLRSEEGSGRVRLSVDAEDTYDNLTRCVLDSYSQWPYQEG